MKDFIRFLKGAAAMLTAVSVLLVGAYADEYPVGNPDTSNWFAWDRPDDEKAMGTAVDASIFLDAPAGKHGFAHADGEDICFEDGTKIKFWGTNVCADGIFQTSDAGEAKEKIKKVVDRIERSGFNLVRFHQLDASFAKINIFGNGGSTKKLDEKELDKFCYFISLLKERGIYYYVDLLVSRSASCTEDNIKARSDISTGWKVKSLFDPYLIELQKEYARQLLTYVNPYTGLALVNDPGMVFLDIHNENSVIGLYKGTVNSSYYKGQLQSGFNKWLAAKYSDTNSLKTAWKQDGKVGLEDDENPENGTVRIPPDYMGASFNYSDMRKRDIYEFLYDLADETYQDFLKYLRDDLGVKCMITGTTIGGDNNDRPATFHLLKKDFDFTDRHSYKSHPVGYGFENGTLTNILSSTITGGGEIYQYTPWHKPFNQPYVVGEWQQCFPNVYAPEMEIIMSVYGSFQNWNPISFDLISVDIGEGNQPQTNFFDTFNDPMHSSVQPNAAIMFHRGEIKEAELEYFVPMSAEDVLDPNWKYLNGYEDVWMYGKIGAMMTDLDDDPEARNQSNLDKMLERYRNNEPQSDEINWNRRTGVFKVETPYSNVMTGFIGKKPQVYDFSDFTVQNSFATVAMNSMTEDTLADSKKILLTTVARAMNTGMQLSDNGINILSTGQGPVIVEPVEGEAVIKTTDEIKIYALTPSGERKAEVAVEKTPEGYSKFHFGKEYKAVHYEISR
ncbi:MAG: hypothetical protein ACI4DY_01015 [Monoglobaceae bacterium]